MAVIATMTGHHYAPVFDANGFQRSGNARETYRVTGLQKTSIPQVAATALNTQGVPAIGAPIPGFQSFICVNHDIEVENSGATASANVTAYYETLDIFGTWELGATTSQETASRDLDGSIFEVKYDIADEGVAEKFGKDTGDTVTQVAQVDFLNPNFTARFRRHESSRSAGFGVVGRINYDSVWNGEPRTWLCTNVNTTPLVEGDWYEVVYDFAYNQAGWPPIVFIRDNEGNVPFDVQVATEPGAEANGSLMAKVYTEISFGNLGFPDPFNG